MPTVVSSSRPSPPEHLDLTLTTTVTITGTGTPIHTANRAGPGVFIRSGDVALQVDAGRGTVMRLAAAGSILTDLDALFVTHHHSDHIVGIPDLLMTRWLNDVERQGQDPLPIYAPEGEASRLIKGMLDVWKSEMQMRKAHTGRPTIAETNVRTFKTSKDQTTKVAELGDVSISAIAVDHEPVVPAVAYRVDTPDGSAVVSGDTAVCQQVEELSAGVDLLIHETIRADGLVGLVSNPQRLLEYHAECGPLGEMAERAGVPRLVLTHMVPPPKNHAEKRAFANEIRAGGFTGEIIVAEDLLKLTL